MRSAILKERTIIKYFRGVCIFRKYLGLKFMNLIFVISISKYNSINFDLDSH